MSTIIPLGGFQLPFQRRLSRLYNDTKKSSDFVKDPVQHAEDPEIKALHRKLKIQKDRLVSWGLEWSDPNQSAEIDESLSKAGLSEIVGSIMSTIKDILAEAEPLWQSSKRLIGGDSYDNSKPTGDRKIPIVAWDKARFEDLVRDLTTSIDTLYDLSRTRSSSQAARARIFLKSSSTEDLKKTFESTRMQTPQQIDPTTLTTLRPKAERSETEGTDPRRGREIVFMSKQAYAEMPYTGTRQPYAPLLLEFAAFDTIYSSTGIMPPMARFEKLSAGLQTEPQRSPGAWTGLPRLLGYFEDMENSRLGLVYQFPRTFNPVSYEYLTQDPLYSLHTLKDLLSRPNFEPRLEAKFRLAYNLANTVFDMHARGIAHGNFLDSNISFCQATSTEPGMLDEEVDIRRPLVSSFELFPDAAADSQLTMTAHLYRHPLDPRVTPQSPLDSKMDTRVLDLYSLAMLLLSIGLWTRLENLVPGQNSPSIPDSVLDQLAIRCGSLYMKAVQICWNAVDEELAGRSSGETLLSNVQVHASRYLEACCIIDNVSGLEDRVRDDTPQRRLKSDLPVLPTGSSQAMEAVTQLASISAECLPRTVESKEPTATISGDSMPPAAIDKISHPEPEKPKLRLYSQVQVPIPPEVVELWNKIVMHRINIALGSFYRKHPESVEISLESVGTSPHATKPTVLVVCTSVNKVRAILKRKLGDLFDEKTGWGLKVCKGRLVRSRKDPASVTRSMAPPADHGSDFEDAVANAEYQERPNNGASIGAWIGNRHLPPVSFGGLVLVDDKPYGMTVHHMLDDPDEAALQGDEPEPVWRSSGHGNTYGEYAEDSSVSSGTEDFFYELSDTDSHYSETDITSDYQESDDGREEEQGLYNEPGDVPGIEPGCGEGYIVTQPAMDDVDDDFYPSQETAAEDHLDTFSLGEVYASSGIRRRRDNGLTHEIDWALFEFQAERLPGDNSIPHAAAKDPTGDAKLRPTTVASASSLPGLQVQCMARTSGLQTGMIEHALATVKIHGRASPSHTYQVCSNPASTRENRRTSIGIPGDSGAWIVDRENGQLCGHVLAWSHRKKVAYICPMDILLQDIADTLLANDVRLPGGQAFKFERSEEGTLDSLATLKSLDTVRALGGLGGKVLPGHQRDMEAQLAGQDGSDDEDLGSLADADEDEDVIPALVEDIPAPQTIPPVGKGLETPSLPTPKTQTPLERRSPSDSSMRYLGDRIDDLDISGDKRIGVSG